MAQRFLDLFSNARLFDLAHEYRTGIPHHPAHPPYLFGMTKIHGEYMWGKSSSAGEAIALGGHVGTHMDALCHFSCGGQLFGGVEVAPIQDHSTGIGSLSIDTVVPVFRRGVLLDVAGYEGVDVLPEDFAIDAAELESVANAQDAGIGAGDVVLIRTGWTKYWNEPGHYINEVRCPGVNEDGANWLSARGIFAGGSDTIAFELTPSQMPVHVHFLVDKGIHIFEALNLESLAAERIVTFGFVAIPLKLAGATGSPVRPVAVVEAPR